MNFNESAGQLYAFGIMAVCGIVLCLIYDGLGAVRSKFGKWYVTVPCDILFGGAAVSLYFLFHYEANFLKLSPFLFLAAALGFAACKFSLSRILAKAAGVLYNFSVKATCKLENFRKNHAKEAKKKHGENPKD